MVTIKNKKVVITQYGPPSKAIQFVTENLPSPPKDHVQCSIIYAGFAGADVNMRLGLYPMQKSPPLTPGYCFSGIVSVNGPGCSKFKPGTRVTALTKYDSQAEYINIPEKYLIPIPDGVSLQHATALTLDWVSAYGCVMRHAKVTRGQRVFVHGLSGAVGQGITILCLLQGATVYGTASERNHAALKEQGAHPYVYTNKDWMKAMKDLGGVHAVFDPIGFESCDESYSILSDTEKSVLVAYGNNMPSLTDGKPRNVWVHIAKVASRNLAVWSPKSTTLFMVTRDQSTFQPELKILLNMVKDGKITPSIKNVWDLDNIREVHDAWGKGAGMGSMIIRCKPEPEK